MAKLRRKKPGNIWAVKLENSKFINWLESNLSRVEVKLQSAKQKLFSDLACNDIIIGYKKERIERIGVIEDIIYSQSKMMIKIDWYEDWRFAESERDLRLPKDFSGLHKVNNEDERIADDLPLKKVDGLINYRPPKPERKTGASKKDRLEDFIRETSVRKRLGRRPQLELEEFIEPEIEEPKKDKGGIINLFYATNRSRTKKSDVNEYYSARGKKLKYGFCEVSIPFGHVQGELERPWKILWFEFPENEEKHICIKKIKEQNETDFFKQFNEIAEETGDDALLFIHGYNTNFAECARRTAQIVRDVPFTGIAGFFSWPSAAKLIGYNHDLANAEWSCSHLEKLITDLLEKTKIKNLHIIAHSMGNKVLGFTLKNLSTNKSIKPKLKKIKQIVLGAPDIDRGVFEKDILPAIKNIGERKTLYTSDKDKALMVSDAIRLGLPRLGEAGEDIFVSKLVDTVDASNIDTELMGHGYIFDTKELLSDLYHLIENNLSPASRRLRAIIKEENLHYWLFPE